MSIRKQIIKRFALVYFIALLFLLPVTASLFRIIFTEGDFWRGRSGRVAYDSMIVLPRRGNILACDGKLLASSIPTYTLYMDFRADGLSKDTFDYYINSLSENLATIYTNMTPAEIKSHMEKGYRKGSRYYRIGKKKLNYTELKRVKQFPLFDKGPNKSGLTIREQVGRKRPFGDLTMGARTIGGLYAEVDKGGKSGLEMYCDSFLRGKPGISSRQKIAGRYRNVNQLDPVEGLDVKTTIDVNIQDITEMALLKSLNRVEADHGCAVVMEVETGEVKAMCNLRRQADGSYIESENFAVSSRTEPGSTFKIASAMVALDAGLVDTSTMINTENGVAAFYGKSMKDWNYNKGGYGRISLNRGIQVSSNIAIAKVIDEKYKSHPEDYINALYKIGLNTPLDFEIPGTARPYIKNPEDPSWSKLSLPWIAHGYEIKFPPIYVLNFYNAIANNGKMVKPFLVKAICKNGEDISTYSTKVINSQICSQNTLGKIRQMMIDVVDHGTASNVRSEYFKVAGKTGTAVQSSNGMRRHQLTFCGFFPADKPKYSAIVVVWYPKPGIYPSAGGISGAVFKDIAECLYAQSSLLQEAPLMVVDSARIFDPITKDGNLKELRRVLDDLNISYSSANEDSWGKSHVSKEGILLSSKDMHPNFVPNVVGMGAKDAVFLLENRGLKVRLSGVGSVASQSLPSGRVVEKGNLIVLNLK